MFNVDTSAFNISLYRERIYQTRESLRVVSHPEHPHLGLLLEREEEEGLCTVASLPPAHPERLGDPLFLKAHGLRFPYIVGEMANGIATAQMVIAAAQNGMMGFFGAAGLMPAQVEENLHRIQSTLGTPKGDHLGNWGSNLIHSPSDPALEEHLVALYLRRKVSRLSASAYINVSPSLVHYAYHGLHLDSEGKLVRPNHVLAKLSRPEVAKHFISPASEQMLSSLVERGKLTPLEAKLGSQLAIAQDITVEADSAGHTDNRPLTGMFPLILQLAESLSTQHAYRERVRVGAAGGLGTPAALAAAFSLGAAYVLTGSINQTAVESGLSPLAKQMLKEASITDIAMAPAADMFEMGVKVQVLKRGTLFSARATKLYELYTRYSSLEEIPQEEQTKIEQTIFRMSLPEVWKMTQTFFEQRDPSQLEKALSSPKHKMALVFRSYLGLSSHWAVGGDSGRKMDYQIWCGPAMGAFNHWAAESVLEPLEGRTVKQIGYNLLEGAAVLTRVQQLRSCGLILPADIFNFRPRVTQ